MSNISDQTIALASMMQSAILIDQLSQKGSLNKAAFDCSMDSLFSIDADSTSAVFGNISGLIVGLKNLRNFLDNTQKSRNRTIIYYVFSMLKIENKLRKDQPMVNQIQQGFIKINQTTEDFGFSDTNKVAKIDDLYQQTLSKIKPRIMVQGEQNFLTNSENTGKIRTLLFSGIRAAVLWRQLGGSRLKLMFSRKKYLSATQQLLQQLPS